MSLDKLINTIYQKSLMKKYHKWLDEQERAGFNKELDEYHKDFLKGIGATPDKFDKEMQKKFKEVIDNALWWENEWSSIVRQKYPEEKYNYLDFKKTYLAVGGCSLIILQEVNNDNKIIYEKSAWKLSNNIKKEFKLLEKMFYIVPDAKNVIKCYSERDHYGVAIELEYIEGETLEQILKNETPLVKEETIQYSFDILNGILELRKAGIYHCDMHDRNILIDYINSRALIIDLGAATENPIEINAKNRLYGGNNDIIGLGLLMYKMITGHNLFNEGYGFSCYSNVKNDIKTIREKVYDDPKLKQRYFDKIKQDIRDPKFADCIVYLLDDDLWTQPSEEKVQKIKERFDNYLKKT